MKIKCNEKRTRWIVCPVCGKKIQKTWMTYSDIKCSCGTSFTVLAASGFVTNIIHEEQEEIATEHRIISYFEAIRKFINL